ncbi:MAG: hypothetical protein WDN28_25195 [Chthoniobacter sp.]
MDPNRLDPDDWSVANLGQLKSVFRFDLTPSTLHNGLPDWWVLAWQLGSVTDPGLAGADTDGDGVSNLQEYLNGTDPTDFYNGQAVVLTVLSGANQTGLPGAFLPLPIIISIKKADGSPWIGAPVTFTADPGLGSYAAANDGSQPAVASLTLQTDSSGAVQVYFQPAASLTGSGYAKAGAQQAAFTATGYDPNSAPSTSPNVTTISVSPTQTDLTWTTNVTNATGFTIERWTYATGWITIGTVNGQTRSFSDTAVPPGVVVAYRVTATNDYGHSVPLPPQSADGSDLNAKDTDGDGLSDAEEIANGSDPNNPDTDGDHVIDGMDLFARDPDLTQPRVPETSYAVINLDDLSAPDSFLNPHEINDALQILDNPPYNYDGPGYPQARLWTNGEFTPIPNPSNEPQRWFELSNAGMTLCVSNSSPLPSYIWTPSGGLSQPTYSSSSLNGYTSVTNIVVVQGLSPSGNVVAYYEGFGSSPGSGITLDCGLFWSASSGPAIVGLLSVIKPPPAPWPPAGNFIPHEVNDNGQVIGVLDDYSPWTSGGQTRQCVAVLDGGSIHPISNWYDWDGRPKSFSLNGSDSPIAVGLNPDAPYGPVLWARVSSSQWKQIPLEVWNPPLAAPMTILGDVYKINDRCEIVGNFFDANYNPLGRLWQNGKIVDLNERTKGSGFTNFYPYTINNKGAILAQATKVDSGESKAVLLLPIEIKATSGTSPTGCKKQYNNSPIIGSVSNLIAAWQGEDITLNVNIPDNLKASLPSGFVKWTTPNYQIADNTTTYTFHWQAPGIKSIVIEVGGLKSFVDIDVPDVGLVTEGSGLLLYVPAPDLARMDLAAKAAKAYVDLRWPHLDIPQKDATRHAYWSALSHSDAIPQEMVLFVTTAHEYLNKWTGKDVAYNSTMDLHNNLFGSTILESNILGVPDSSAIINLIDQAYKAGSLWIWDGNSSSAKSEGILSKSNGARIFHPH